jgi:hypothetical protein
MLGLAMVAAIAAMAFIGAGTASAKLCKDINCVGVWNTPTTILVSSEATKLTGSITVLCKSHATLVHEGESAGVLFGKFTLLDWTGCSGCTEVTTTALGTFDDKATGGGNGEILPLNVTVLLKNCPFGAECTAKSINGTTKLSLTGGSIGTGGTAKGEANTEVSLSGFGCGSKGTWVTETGNPYKVLLVEDSSGDFTSGVSIFQL